MGLLGKTLKGKSTITRENEEPKNKRIREVIVPPDQIENEKKKRAMKEAYFRKMVGSEEKIFNINKKKLLVNWRNIMRIAKTEKLKSELEVYAQSNQRDLDSNEAFLQMLDKNLEEVEDQYNLALRNHLIQMDKLLEIRDNRISALKEEFQRSAKILYQEFNSEAKDIKKTHLRQVKELNDMTDCTNEEEQQKKNLVKEAYQTALEQTSQKSKEEIEVMQNEMRSKQGTLSNYLETLYQRYMNDTKDKFDKFQGMMQKSSNSTRAINETMKKISRTKEWIQQMNMKIVQMEVEFKQRNQALLKEKDAINQNFLELKKKMAKFRDGERKKLTELVLNSKHSVDNLNSLSALGEKILKTAELCRRLETEREKVIPFYESTVTEEDIPEDLRVVFNEISEGEFRRYSYVQNYFKRYNKVLLDKIAIQQQKEIYLRENKTLKRLLKQYIDDISVNDDVMANQNPLFVTSKVSSIPKTNLTFPVQAFNRSQGTVLIDGNVERAKITKQRMGIR